ncbi:MAG TPA: hypothetical protein VHM02_00205 [Thermoanaerobaculia bacterium]|nr:hypothetical protein [Thermoanaerobaculia bacterium]
MPSRVNGIGEPLPEEALRLHIEGTIEGGEPEAEPPPGARPGL